MPCTIIILKMVLSYKYDENLVSETKILKIGSCCFNRIDATKLNMILCIYPCGFSLHYTNVSVGTPATWFLVALDTGSDLFWLPCNCGTTCIRDLKDIGLPRVPFSSRKHILSFFFFFFYNSYFHVCNFFLFFDTEYTPQSIQPKRIFY